MHRHVEKWQIWIPITVTKLSNAAVSSRSPGLPKWGGGDRGAGDREKRGREVYGRREKRGREAGFPRWREVGEKGKNYGTLSIFRNRKNAKGRERNNTGREPGLKGTESGRFKPPCPPLPLNGSRGRQNNSREKGSACEFGVHVQNMWITGLREWGFLQSSCG